MMPAVVRLYDLQPNFRLCGPFDGREDAGPWLQSVYKQFQRAGHTDMHADPSATIRAIASLCRGSAASVLQRERTLAWIVARAQVNEASYDDLVALERQFRTVFPATRRSRWCVVDGQQPTESIEEYYDRVVDRWLERREHARPEDGAIGDDEGGAGERSLMEWAIKRFVRGLSERRVRLEAESRGCYDVSSLHACFEIVQQCKKMFDELESQAAEMDVIREFIPPVWHESPDIIFY